MAKQRHNIDTIAEILIDKIKDLEKNAQRLENTVNKAVNAEIKVNTTEMTQAYSERREEEKQFLADLRVELKKQHSRVPNWITLVLVFGFTLSAAVLIGFFVLNYK